MSTSAADPTEEKSSFLKPRISKQDAIIQFLRPQLANKVAQNLGLFDNLVTELETITKLGTRLQPSGENHVVTADDLRATLDEFPELEAIASKGRAFLVDIGYESPRQSSPLPGSVPAVGVPSAVKPVVMQLPGSAPVTGAVVNPTPSKTGKH